MSIPKIIHYCFGMTPDFGGKPFGLVHYVCILSAIERIRPDSVYLYFEYEPTGAWWDLIKPRLTPVKMIAPREFEGRPIVSPAHRADVVRLVSLLNLGGIYLDADVFVHRDFDSLLAHSVVLGQEGHDAQFGLANAVILAEPNAPFIRVWLEQYRWFRGGSSNCEPFWNEHSVQLPHFMSRLFENTITILDYQAFYWPLWVEQHLVWIFDSEEPIDLSRSFATHLWESQAWTYLKDLTPGQVRRSASNFSRWATPFLENLTDDFGIPVTTVRTMSDDGSHRRAVFQSVYADHEWGSDGLSRFYSGVGSRAGAASIYVDRMRDQLDAIKTVENRDLHIVDLGCGDFHVSSELLKAHEEMSYTGCDIVPELIEYNQSRYGRDRITFKAVDAVTDPLPPGDICLVRQVFQHIGNRDIETILQKLTQYKYVFVTEGQPKVRVGACNPDKNANADVRFDWRTGRGRGVELDQAPFERNIIKIFDVELEKETIVTYQVLNDVPEHSVSRPLMI